MGLIGDFLTAGTKHRKERELEEELYAATHTCYKAYCRICGATSSGNFRTPEDAEPYDTHEGGYLNKDSFVDTDYAVQKVFSENPLPEDVRKELVDHLNKESSFWKETDKN